MSGEEGDTVKKTWPDWRVRAGPRKKPTQMEREGLEARTVQRLVHTLHDC